MKKMLSGLLLAVLATPLCGQKKTNAAPVSTTNRQEAWDAPRCGNPFIPGYFADPTIRKFGDTYYIYATTDGTGNGYGPAQVWMSKDFVHWRNQVMNWPTTEVVWAPDVLQTPQGKYHYYYCEPCMLHVGESDSPVGPWHNMLGKADAVLMPDRYCDPMAITLDPMVFTDDDGSRYIFVGTWGIYDKSGCGWAKLAEDGKSFTEKGLVPNTQLKDFFEAPYVFKRGGKYYFTYSSGSCHDDTYRVQYAVSTAGPTGPYEYKGCILRTNADGTIHGPGHHSFLVDNGQYYIVYHRHNNPHSVHGFNRQLCIDKVEFDKEGNILPIQPTHQGLLPASLQAKARKQTFRNLAFGAKVTASSVLSPSFKAEYAVDDNNGTLWRPANNQGSAWLELDLGQVQRFNQVWLQFEYPTFFYQYKVETSVDGRRWTLYADKTQNREAGSPLIEKKEAQARYLRITITDTQKNGHFGALWNIMVYQATKGNDPESLLPRVDNLDMSAVEKGYPNLHRKDVEDNERTTYPNGLVLALNADDPRSLKDLTLTKGHRDIDLGQESQEGLIREVVKGKYGFFFDGKLRLKTKFDCPRNFTYNAAFTLSAWVLNPTVGPAECLACVTPQTGDLTSLQFNNGRDGATGLMNHAGSFESIGQPKEVAKGEGQWQHWTISYDGWHERVYLNGQLLSEKNNFLMLRPNGPITIGAQPDGGDAFSGYLHSLKLYDRALTPQEAEEEYQAPSDTHDHTALDTRSLQLKAASIGPDLYRIDLVDGQGKAVQTGRLDFISAIFSAPAGKDFSLTLHDDEGNAIPLTVSLPQAKEETHTAFVLKEQAEAVRLESQDKNLDRDPSHNGPMRLEEVEGDFLLQVRVSDLMGRQRRSTPAYNEGGIIILKEEGDGRSQNLVHLGVFPNYDCGNMLTTVSRFGRPQYPNQQGWDFDPYLQLQRQGDLIHARTSKDGQCWVEMPGSPVRVSLLGEGKLKVGLYQTTYSANKGWVEFQDYKLWKQGEKTEDQPQQSRKGKKGTQALLPPPGKEIYIPRDLVHNDFTSQDAQWSYARMAYTKDIVIFWEKPFGEDPMKAPDLQGQPMKVNVQNLLKRTQEFYDFYKKKLKFIGKGSKANKYRMMVMLNYSLEGTAYGGDYDGQIGALWVTPNRVQDFRLNCIAHELGHSFQSQISCDGQGQAWGGGGIFEMTSQWMLWQVNPEWTTDENYHWQDFIRQANLSFLAGENIYHSPYVLEYWSMKHGLTIMGQMFREGRRGEDPASTYMRLFNLSNREFAQEVVDCYSRLLTFDFPDKQKASLRYSNQFVNDKPLHAFGSNVIPLKGEPGKLVGVQFLGAPDKGYAYRIVALNEACKATYGPISTEVQGTATLQLPADTQHAYLVVTGYPLEKYQYDAEKVYHYTFK